MSEPLSFTEDEQPAVQRILSCFKEELNCSGGDHQRIVDVLLAASNRGIISKEVRRSPAFGTSATYMLFCVLTDSTLGEESFLKFKPLWKELSEDPCFPKRTIGWLRKKIQEVTHEGQHD